MPVESINSLGQGLKAGAGGEEFAAKGAGAGVEVAGGDEIAHEIGFQEDVGVERKHPFGAAGADTLVLGGGKTGVLQVLDDANAVTEFPQNLGGAVGRGVVHDDHVQRHIPLIQNGFQAGRRCTGRC